MALYLALLRGINVGGNTTLPMKELASIFRTLGYQDIRTYIQSGNVVFQSNKTPGPMDAARIGKTIREKHGIEPRVLILSKGALRHAIEANPFPTQDGKALHFFFLQAEPKAPALERLSALKGGQEAYSLGDGVFYLLAPKGIGVSRLAPAIESALGVPVTARNWNTIHKLASMLDSV